MLKHLETFQFEPGAQQTRQASIVQAAARKGDLLDASYVARHTCSEDESKGHAGVKTRGDAGFGDTGANVIKQLAPQRSGGDAHGLVRVQVALELNQIA